ncbi:unnamed protein product [Cuscuta epithymum]|uniref:Uncharacterized protein n=1 Tax=Cuscuta epithymum TaxID=186058 RepID=A0AAV0DP91_9ASTE|nr:unnamed protein product [Cuscuta epithymum]
MWILKKIKESTNMEISLTQVAKKSKLVNQVPTPSHVDFLNLNVDHGFPLHSTKAKIILEAARWYTLQTSLKRTYKEPNYERDACESIANFTSFAKHTRSYLTFAQIYVTLKNANEMFNAYCTIMKAGGDNVVYDLNTGHPYPANPKFESVS